MNKNKIAEIIFEKVTGIELESVLEALGISKTVKQKAINRVLTEFKDDLLSKHQKNPDYDGIIAFIENHGVFENFLKIHFNLSNKPYSNHLEFIEYLKSQEPIGVVDKDFLFNKIEDLRLRLEERIEQIANISKEELAIHDRMHEPTRVMLEEILEKLDKISDNINIKSDKNKLTQQFINKSKIINLHLGTPTLNITSLTTIASSEYKYGFHILLSFAFEGDFGNNPSAFLFYSKDNSPICAENFDLSQQGLQRDNLSILKLENTAVEKGHYAYNIAKQDTYYSNSGDGFDLRPFIFIILGDETLGFATFIVHNKYSSKFEGGVGEFIPLLIGNEYRPPIVQDLVWPNKIDLLQSLHSPYTRSYLYLKREEVDGVISIKEYFLNSLKKEVRDALIKYMNNLEN